MDDSEIHEQELHDRRMARERVRSEEVESLRAEVERLKPLQSPSLFAEVARLRAEKADLQKVIREGLHMRCSKCAQAEARLAKVVEAAVWVLLYDHGPDCKSCQNSRAEFRAALAAAQPEEEK